ncbi:MAG: hypothetical protein JW732_00995 [Dehalococcoidia bacterium]|nr:hypothetical protein [Dehalococcoidia bacterium]
MSNIGSRIKRLEQQREADKPRATIVYVYDSKSETRTRSAKQKAIAEYKAKHPDWQPSPKDLYIQVIDTETKELTERVIAGERTG